MTFGRTLLHDQSLMVSPICISSSCLRIISQCQKIISKSFRRIATYFLDSLTAFPCNVAFLSASNSVLNLATANSMGFYRLIDRIIAGMGTHIVR